MTAFDKAWNIVKYDTNNIRGNNFSEKFDYFPKKILYLDIEYKLVDVDEEAIEYDAHGEPMGTYVPSLRNDDVEQVIYLNLHDAKHARMLWLNKPDDDDDEKSTPLQEEIEDQKELGMEVDVETGDVHNPDMSQALYNLYDYYDQDTGEKIEKSEFDKAWGVVKASPCCDRPRLIERQDGSTRCRTCQQSKVSKEAPTEECKGCGLAHGSPNSEYCSEICERQNMKKSDDMLRDALARKLPSRKEFSEKEIEAMMGRRVLPPRKNPEDDPLVHRARKNLMEERKNRRQ